MTVEELYQKLIILKRDGYGDFPLAYSTDDEGNEYNLVNFEPSLACFDEIRSRNMDIIHECTEYNAVIIN